MIKTRNVIIIVLSIQLAILGLVGLTAFGFYFPVLRPIIGFVYLTFIPGFLILCILRQDRIGSIETLLYSVGLSIAFLMFVGLFINMLYPLIYIPRPISIYPVLATITVVVLILCNKVYKLRISRNDAYSQDRFIQSSELFSPPSLYLLLLPILSALGSFSVYSFYNNAVLLILLILIGLIPILIAFDKFFPEKLYPLAVAAIGIALLWQRSLLTFDLPKGDILVEYYYQGIVLRDSLWNPNIAANVNAMLSVAMLPPIYSIVLNLNSIWVYKIIYPLFYSLVPTVLFQVYRKQINDKAAFLAAFFFMSFPEFLFTMPLLARQIVAELFVALSILLFLRDELNSTTRAILLVIFGVCTVVSHYGLSYIYMFYLILTLLLVRLLKDNAANELWESLLEKFHRPKENANFHAMLKPINCFQQKSTLNVTYVMLFIVFCLSWYLHISSASPLNSAIRIGDHIYSSLATELFSWDVRDPHIAQAMGLAQMRSTEIEWYIARIFQYITQLFIIVGIIDFIFNYHKIKFRPEYAAMSFLSMLLILMCITLPFFAGSLNMTRIYHISLMFLAPFCILGGIALFQFLFRIIMVLLVHIPQNDIPTLSLKVVVLFVLVPYFLFTSGFIFELTGATATSAPLSYGKTDWPFYNKVEIQAADWLLMIRDDNVVYCDIFSLGLMSYLYELNAKVKSASFPNDIKNIDPGSYIFLRSWNVVHKEILLGIKTGESIIYKNIEEIMLSKNFEVNKIYDNSEAQVWWRSR